MSGADREPETSDLERGGLTEIPLNPPTPATRVSLPVRFVNPQIPTSEVAEISVDNLFVTQTAQIIHKNETFLQNINHTLVVDRVLDHTEHSLQINILDQTINMENNGTVLEPSKLQPGTSNESNNSIEKEN